MQRWSRRQVSHLWAQCFGADRKLRTGQIREDPAKFQGEKGGKYMLSISFPVPSPRMEARRS